MIHFYKIPPKILTFLVALSLVTISYAQELTINGKVTDGSNNESIPGVTVIAKGFTGVGTITDINGKYTIVVPKAATTLVFSFVGMISQEIAIENRSTIDVILAPDILNLDEVIVVGYGTQRKRDVTGAITKIDAKLITDMPTSSFEAAIQGKAAGVQVIQGSGVAGNGSVIRVRGVGSVSVAGDPLYVVDGIPITQNYFLSSNRGGMNNNPLATLDPNDIESIEILKDAGSAGIYGSRGANGVILITTKRGKKGKPSFNFTARTGISRPAFEPKLVSKDEWLQLRQEAWENDGGTGYVWLPNYSSATASLEDREEAFLRAKQNNTDWWDLTTQTGFKQEYAFSAQQGTEKFQIYTGLTLDQNQSYLKGNSYDRYSGRVNVDYQIIKDLKASVSTSFSHGINKKVAAAWTGGTGGAMSTSLPIYPVYDSTGAFNRYTTSANESNPVERQVLRDWRNIENRTIDNLTLTYTPLDNLTVTAYGGLDYMDLREYEYEPPAFQRLKTPDAGFGRERPTYVTNWTANTSANYILDINADQRITFLFGGEIQKSTTQRSTIEINDVAMPLYEDWQRSYTYTTMEKDTNNDNVVDYVDTTYLYKFNKTPQADLIWTFSSLFGRINYSIKDKYVLQAVARVDGSSKFGVNNRYGFFPAVSAIWRVSEESFFKNLFVSDDPIISNLKLRASYGITGNANIPVNEWIGTYSPPGNNNNYNNVGITFPNRLENPDLKWETLHNMDIALEFGILNERISGEFAFYNKVTKDVLINRTNPPSQGFGSYWDNVGEILNRGYEFNIISRNLIGQFKWRTDFNISHNHNEVLSLGDLTPDAVGGGTNDTRIVVGEPVGANFLVRFSHVDPADGMPVWLDKDGIETKTFDLNDRVVVGDVMPDFIGGITNTFEYKGFDFSFLFAFTIGGNIYDGSGKRQLGVITDWQMRQEIYDRWREPGDIAKYPRLTLLTSTYDGLPSEWQYNSTLFLYDATFVRLRNVSIGYTLPKAVAAKAKLNTARIFITATNLWTWAKNCPFDPEIARDFENEADRNMSSNITYLTPPQEKSLTFGINITF